MKAMILAAGRGERLKPITDTLPKALVEVQGEPLVLHHIRRLKNAGISDIVINLAYLGEKIKTFLGNGNAFGVNIIYSREQNPGLETGGGIVKALPLLGDDPFWVVNGDIYSDFSYPVIPLNHGVHGHLILVNNPKHNLKGDFGLNEGLVTFDKQYTFSGIALYHPNLFHGFAIDRYPITLILKQAISKQKVSGQLYQGLWHDIGTPERLEAVNNRTL